MTKNFPAYDLVSWKENQGVDVAEYMDEYMDAQPLMMPCFEKHAETETAFFREVGLMCSCESPVPAVLNCQLCGKPLDRITVLAAELTANVPDGVRQVVSKKKGKG